MVQPQATREGVGLPISNAPALGASPGQIRRDHDACDQSRFGKPSFLGATIHLRAEVGEWVERQGGIGRGDDCFPEKPFG